MVTEVTFLPLLPPTPAAADVFFFVYNGEYLRQFLLCRSNTVGIFAYAVVYEFACFLFRDGPLLLFIKQEEYKRHADKVFSDGLFRFECSEKSGEKVENPWDEMEDT